MCRISLVIAVLFATLLSPMLYAESSPPNIVVIFLDDAGWSDFRPFGTPAYPTPHVDELASEGCRFNNFYVPQAVCSASRAALLTGCWPGRTQMFGAHGPRARGLEPTYATLGEVLKTAGYATAVFGKWHVGDQEDTRPPARGFDESCGLMYSNDMWRFHPNPKSAKHFGQHPLQYWDNGEITIEDVTPEQQTQLTTWYTERAVDFIHRKKDQPFFVYVPHSMPHVPLYVSDKFKDKSGTGLYGDVMMEIDWSVGQINQALKDAGVEDNTIIAFTSDNGPWHSYGNHAGKTPYREAKGTSFDGGIRSACIIKAPGHIKAGSSSDRTFSTLDFMPTFAARAGAALPENPVDGKDVWGIMTGKRRAKNENAYYPLSISRTFEGVLSGDGDWKLHIPHSYRVLIEPKNDGLPGPYKRGEIGLELFNLRDDPMETTNVFDKYPEVAEKLFGYAKEHMKTFYPKQKLRL